MSDRPHRCEQQQPSPAHPHRQRRRRAHARSDAAVPATMTRLMGAMARRLPALPLIALLWASIGLCTAVAQTAPAGGIYSCIDAQGRRLTADRPIPECTAREQQVLNRDGSVRAVHPPTLTAEERARKEARERVAAEAAAAQREAVRRDRNLMARFADEAAHQRAREAALDTVRLASKATELRLRELAAERKPLLDEVEFYKGRALPPKLKASLDANDAAREAQRAAAQNQQAEMARIGRLYDVELERLRRLWAGAPPGSLDAGRTTAAAPAAASARTR